MQVVRLEALQAVQVYHGDDQSGRRHGRREAGLLENVRCIVDVQIAQTLTFGDALYQVDRQLGQWERVFQRLLAVAKVE